MGAVVTRPTGSLATALHALTNCKRAVGAYNWHPRVASASGVGLESRGALEATRGR